MGDFSVLATRIKELRASLNMTQRDFAKHVGCTAATLSAYENGSKSPSLEIIKNVAEKCHVSIDWLCGLTDKKENSKKPRTYADVVDTLFSLLNHKQLNFDICKFEDIDAILFGFENKKVNDFFRDWLKIKKLYDENVIDKSIYEPWLKSKLEDLNCEIKSICDGSFIDFQDRVNDLLY